MDGGDLGGAGLRALGVEENFEGAASDGAGPDVPDLAQGAIEGRGEVGGHLQRLHAVERGPGAVGLGALHRGAARRGHQALRLQALHMRLVHPAPVRPGLPRADPEHGAAVVLGAVQAVHPAVGEAFLNDRLIGEVTVALGFLVGDEPDSGEGGVVRPEPGAELRAARHLDLGRVGEAGQRNLHGRPRLANRSEGGPAAQGFAGMGLRPPNGLPRGPRAG